MLGVGAKAGYLDEKGNLPGIEKCFQVDAVSTSVGALFGIPSMTTYLESSAGVEAWRKNRAYRYIYRNMLSAHANFFHRLC